MAGFSLYPPQVDFGSLFYVSTEITIIVKVIKQFFTITHHKPEAHGHGTTMMLATDYALFCFASS
jgi:hypothetical protein